MLHPNMNMVTFGWPECAYIHDRAPDDEAGHLAVISNCLFSIDL